MKIAIAADHAGVRLKEELKRTLERLGAEVRDLGTTDETPVDYPDFAEAVARAVAAGEVDRGVLVCGTGIGMSIVANKISGVRASLVCEEFSARASRRHNDANVLCLGARVVGPDLAVGILAAWLAEPYEGGRHAPRLLKIADLDSRRAGSARKPARPVVPDKPLGHRRKELTR